MIQLSNASLLDMASSLWNWEKHSVEHVTVPMSFGEQSTIDEENHEVTTSFAQEFQTKNDPGIAEMVSGSSNADSQDGSSSPTPVKLRDITEIYARCNMSIIEPENFAEASRDKG
ncbi:unnamed protein product [Prunus armeniaca]